MNLQDYQKQIEKFDQSPQTDTYYVFGMADELSKIATAILRYEHDKTQENVAKLWDECGDFLWYFTRYCEYFDLGVENIGNEFGYESSLFINSAVLAYLQLSSALGVVLGYEKKFMRGDENPSFSPIADLTYIFNMFSVLVSSLGQTIEQIAERNYEKLSDRLERGVIKGDGDDR